MINLKKLGIVFKAIQELGIHQIGHFTLYELALRTGWTEWQSRKALQQVKNLSSTLVFNHPYHLPERQRIRQAIGNDLDVLISQADKICQGKAQIFGDEWVEINFFQSQKYQWFSGLALSERSQNTYPGLNPLDLKPIWEIARFSWVYPLSRAYWITSDERYAVAFWEYFEQFNEHNPPYYGYNWLSAQEAALRLIAWTFAYPIFENSPQSTSLRKDHFLKTLAEHAARIPSTLDYSLAQNNNHLLSDAAGLITASICLSNLPQRDYWWELGWHWFNWGIQHQIQEDGAYLQHSCNYQRLMLQLALWVNLMLMEQNIEFPAATRDKLAKATMWLYSLMDPSNGRSLNFGPNDGSLIQPLSIAPFDDYRPVVQAASRAFLKSPLFAEGNWDEMSLWYGLNTDKRKSLDSVDYAGSSLALNNSIIVLRPQGSSSWAAMRCTHFYNRPGHADQLHVDMWWEGINLVKDAGTYLYTAQPPWNNSLAETFYHNTLTINHTNQMIKLGRFLWVNWAQGKLVSYSIGKDSGSLKIVAEHYGYRKWGAVHRRSLESDGKVNWTVFDEILPYSNKFNSFSPPIHVRLHWLLEDFPWEIKEEEDSLSLMLQPNQGDLEIRIRTQQFEQTQRGLVRRGVQVYGELPISSPYGWYSPTYGKLQPALSIVLDKQVHSPDAIETIWNFRR